MRRGRTFKHGRLVPVLFAGTVGYLIGGWHGATSDSDSSVAQSIALRFPQEWNTASPASSVVEVPTAATAATAAATASMIKAAAQLALFSPVPMVPQPNPEPVRNVSAAAAMPAGAEAVGSSLTANTGTPPMPASRPAAAARSGATAEAPAAAVAVRHAAANRPGYLLDDAQIASIRERLHLTPDQERMWPAVEAALRNIAYARVPAAQRRGAQLAAVDPDGVDGLKSAAVPLIMSFNDEQKQEVRDLVHVMGLDQLASQF